MTAIDDARVRRTKIEKMTYALAVGDNDAEASTTDPPDRAVPSLAFVAAPATQASKPG